MRVLFTTEVFVTFQHLHSVGDKSTFTNNQSFIE